MSTEAQAAPAEGTPVAAALPPEQQQPAPALTPEQQEIEKIRKATSFLAGKIIDHGNPEEEKPKPKKDPEPEAKATEEPPAPKPKPAPKKKLEPQAMSPEQIATLAANTAIEVTKRREKEAEKEEPEIDPATVELAEEFAPNRQYYEWMQRENPKKYGKLIKQIAEWGPKEIEYSEQWEKDNPGRKFDPESDEHDEFYADNQPKIDPTDLKKAKEQVAQVQESLKEDKQRRKILEEIEPELKEIRMQKVAKEAGPKLQEAARNAVVSVLEGINPEYAKHIDDTAKLNEIAEADPIAADIGRELSAQYVPLATEIVAFHRGIPFDKNNPAHVNMYYRTIDLERRIQQLDQSEQIYEGKMFTSQAEFSQMSPAQKSKHWIVGEQELLMDLAAEAKQTASQKYKLKSDEFNRYSKRKPAGNATNGEHQRTPEPAPRPQRASAPSVIPGPAVNPGSSGAGGAKKSGLDRFHERLVGVSE